MPFNWHTQEVSMRDLDGFGHVNNAVYLTYVENARVAYFRDVVGRNTPEEFHNVIAKAWIDFKAPISFPSAIRVGASVIKLGDKSFEMKYSIETGDGQTAAEAGTVQVNFDPETGRPAPLPADWRAAIEKFEGELDR